MFYLAYVLYFLLIIFFKHKKIYGVHIKNKIVRQIQRPYSNVIAFFEKIFLLNDNSKNQFYKTCVFILMFIAFMIVQFKISIFLDGLWGEHLCGYDNDGDWACMGNFYFALASTIGLHFFLYNKYSLGNKTYDKIKLVLDNISIEMPENLQYPYKKAYNDYLAKLPYKIILNEEWESEEHFVFLTVLQFVENYFYGDYHLYRGVLMNSEMKQLHEFFLQESLKRGYLNQEEYNNIKEHRTKLIMCNG
ncbi:MAG: hypothetical protein ACD_20C00237G0001 [uncultured bacterium]|nr:MAG: hypothetical protein ACD_20C00237G0001 [uncultured bacterium]